MVVHRSSDRDVNTVYLNWFKYHTSESTQWKCVSLPKYLVTASTVHVARVRTHLKLKNMYVKEKINHEWCVRVRAAASYLPAEVSVVHVTHKQRLGGESVGLDIDISSGHLARKTIYSMLILLKTSRDWNTMKPMKCTSLTHAQLLRLPCWWNWTCRRWGSRTEAGSSCWGQCSANGTDADALLKGDDSEISHFHLSKKLFLFSASVTDTVTLFQILQTWLLSFQDGAHTTQSGSLQLFTPVQRIAILHQTHIVFGNTGGLEKRQLQTCLLSVSGLCWIAVVSFSFIIIMIMY